MSTCVYIFNQLINFNIKSFHFFQAIEFFSTVYGEGDYVQISFLLSCGELETYTTGEGRGP